MHQRSIRSLTALVGLALLSLSAPSFALSSEQVQAYARWKTALADQLHMNAAGYALCQGIILGHLRKMAQTASDISP